MSDKNPIGNIHKDLFTKNLESEGISVIEDLGVDVFKGTCGPDSIVFIPAGYIVLERAIQGRKRSPAEGDSVVLFRQT